MKARKFLLHVKLSKNDNFIHDHELYEMMRSRQLYNIHKNLRKKLGQTIRGIENAEKVHVANIEAQRSLFLQRVKPKERLKLTQIPLHPEYDNPRRKGKILSSVNHALNTSFVDTGVAGVTELPGFVARSKASKYSERSIFLDAEVSCRLYHHPTMTHVWKPIHNRSLRDNTTDKRSKTEYKLRIEPSVHDNMRRNRLHTMREYTQLLDKRVREFTV